VMRGNEGDEMPIRFSYSHAEESGHRRCRSKEVAAQASGGGRHPQAGPNSWAERP
jgi:hypothetical protein